MDMRLWDGTRAQACVTGRDDNIGLALLRPLIEPAGTYDYLALSTESPSVGQELEQFHHPRLSPVLYQRTTKVEMYFRSSNGYNYLLMDAADNIAAGGAVLLDESGRMQGMRLPLIGPVLGQIANPGVVIAIDASDVAGLALPVLRSGRMQINTVPSVPDYHSPPLPPIPVIFNGEISIDGAPGPVGTLAHAKLSKEGQPDYWQSTVLGMAGEYVLPLSADSSYLGGSVEFWVDCKRSPATTAYEGPLGRAVELDLAF